VRGIVFFSTGRFGASAFAEAARRTFGRPGGFALPVSSPSAVCRMVPDGSSAVRVVASTKETLSFQVPRVDSLAGTLGSCPGSRI
jgi:hypothetical protein